MNELYFPASQTGLSLAELHGPPPPRLTEYETSAWQLCRQWLAGDSAFRLHTSGSTGTPKPLVLTRARLAASAALTVQTLGLRPGDAALANLPVQYIAGLMMLVRGLAHGLPLTVVAPSANPLAGFAAGTVFRFQSYVPLQVEAILDGPPAGAAILATAKAVLVGGAAVSSELEARLHGLPVPVYHTYGMTETVSHVALRRLDGPAASPAYTALAGIRFETDARDCLVVHAPALSDAPVVTNDVVALESGAAFRWLGRADNVINSGGVKVQAEAVEKAAGEVLHAAGVWRRHFVAGRPHPRLGQAVVWVVEGEPLPAAQEAALLERLKANLPRYAAPTRVAYVPAFSETPTSKVNRLQTLQCLPDQTPTG